MSANGLEEVAACSCGSRDLAPGTRGFRLAGAAFSLRRCRACGRMLLDPRPGKSAIPDAYSGAYYGAGSRKFVPAIEGVVDRFRDGRARFAARFLGPGSAPGSPRVLDIGCGSGQFLARLARMGYECHGTELSPETGERASKIPGLKLQFGDLTPQTYPSRSFDLISIWHVLEHLPDPDSVLRLCREWLRDGGALLIAVPNIDSWQARLFRGSWFHIDPPRHLHHFSRGSLASALEKAGFRIDRMRTLSWEQNLYGILQSALNAMGFPRDEFYEVLKGNRPITASWRLPLEAFLLAGLSPAALVFAALEAAFGAGGTLECVARPAEPPSR